MVHLLSVIIGVGVVPNPTKMESKNLSSTFADSDFYSNTFCFHTSLSIFPLLSTHSFM